jgi:hypothetical protein
MATVVGNIRVTDGDVESDTHHIVLDFGAKPFPVLEGQSIGVLPPGVDAAGRTHVARQYSLSSPRDGERRGYNNIALTGKARHGGPCRRTRPRRLLELPVRSREGRHRAGHRAVRQHVPDAGSSAREPADDLHGHRVGADARDDRAQATVARGR